MSKDYKVGYGKPPKDTQFKPGRSGNPKGRRKGSKNLKKLIDENLNKKILVRVGKKASELTMQEAMVIGMLTRAMKGHVRPAKWIEEHCPEAFADPVVSHGDMADKRQELFKIFKGVAEKAENKRSTMRGELRRSGVPDSLINDALGPEPKELKSRKERVRRELIDHGIQEVFVNQILGDYREPSILGEFQRLVISDRSSGR